MRSVFLCLSLMLALAACETKYPNGPPLREVETDEDRLFLGCLSGGVYAAAPECQRFVSGRER
jgi:hypothetical protein